MEIIMNAQEVVNQIEFLLSASIELTFGTYSMAEHGLYKMVILRNTNTNDVTNVEAPTLDLALSEAVNQAKEKGWLK
jgi:hypothetical protein